MDARYAVHAKGFCDVGYRFQAGVLVLWHRWVCDWCDERIVYSVLVRTHLLEIAEYRTNDVRPVNRDSHDLVS